MVNTIERCTECPFTVHVYEQGFCGNCCKFDIYTTISNKGTLKNCPLKKEDITIHLAKKENKK